MQLRTTRVRREHTTPKITDIFGSPLSIPTQADDAEYIVDGELLLKENDPLYHFLTNNNNLSMAHLMMKKLAKKANIKSIVETVTIPSPFGSRKLTLIHFNDENILATKYIEKKTGHNQKTVEKVHIEKFKPVSWEPSFEAYYSIGNGIYQRDHEILVVLSREENKIVGATGEGLFPITIQIENEKLKMAKRIVLLKSSL